MINFLSYSHVFKEFKLLVKRETENGKKQSHKMKHELPDMLHPGNNESKDAYEMHRYSCRICEGEAKQEYFQRFKLQPGFYVFSTAFRSFQGDVCEWDPFQSVVRRIEIQKLESFFSTLTKFNSVKNFTFLSCVYLFMWLFTLKKSN